MTTSRIAGTPCLIAPQERITSGGQVDNSQPPPDHPVTIATELSQVDTVGESWHRLYVELDVRDRSVWEIQRLDAGGEYRILRNLAESPRWRRPRWESIRALFCIVACPMCPDLDEPEASENEFSFLVSHGGRSCEVGKAVVRNAREALSYCATVFDMNRKGRADEEFLRRLRFRRERAWGS